MSCYAPYFLFAKCATAIRSRPTTPHRIQTLISSTSTLIMAPYFSPITARFASSSAVSRIAQAAASMLRPLLPARYAARWISRHLRVCAIMRSSSNTTAPLIVWRRAEDSNPQPCGLTSFQDWASARRASILSFISDLYVPNIIRSYVIINNMFVNCFFYPRPVYIMTSQKTTTA